jgi:F-type H+-transporting ATPase subunit a
MHIDPIEQFQIKNFLPLLNAGGHHIAFNNAAVYMLLVVAAASLLFIGATARRALVPGRLQSIAEMTYEFVATTLRNETGTEGMKFLPFVFTLFMFILFANLIGLIPYTFEIMAQLIVRLFGNMLAGHITLQVFAAFVIMLAGYGVLGWFGATLPFVMVVLIFALELLVAVVQAYVFAILTCIYLNDAIHPGH